METSFGLPRRISMTPRAYLVYVVPVQNSAKVTVDSVSQVFTKRNLHKLTRLHRRCGEGIYIYGDENVQKNVGALAQFRHLSKPHPR
jgi:hypothetical protein